MGINPFSIPPLACSILIFTLGVLVLAKKPASPLNRQFLYTCLTITLWLAFYAISYSLTGTASRLITPLYKIAYCGINFIILTWFHFIVIFTQTSRYRLWIKLNYIYGLIICFLIFKTDLILNGFYDYFWGFYPKAGILHPYFLSYFVFLCVWGIWLLFLGLKSAKQGTIHHTQYRYILLGLTIITLACIDFIPNYGIEMYPVGYIPTTLFIITITYAIIKHQIMDVSIVIRKSLIYSLLIAIVSVTYALCILLFEKTLQGFFGYRTIAGSVLAGTIIAVLFIPLRHIIQKFVDGIFFHGNPIHAMEENEQLRKEITQSEKHKAVATLASGIAHEIRNPLTALKTFFEYYPQKRNDPEFLKTFQTLAATELGRIENLTQQLLEFAKPAPLELQNIEINQVIDSSLSLLQSQIKKGAIQVEADIKATIGTLIPADPNKLKQALINIILNAVDAMPAGGTLTIETRIKGIEELRSKRNRIYRNRGIEDLRNKGETHSSSPQIPNSSIPQFLKSSNPLSLELTITDTGCGIDKKDLSHIFEPFFTKKAKGTGLGLAITKGIVEEHGGKISVESTPGAGTMFILQLPAKETLKTITEEN